MSETKAVTKLENQVLLLRQEAATLKNSLDQKESTMLNSLPSFTAAMFGNADITSTAPLAYNNVYAPVTLQYQTLMYAYKSYYVLQNSIDMPIQDALRGGLDFHSDELDKDDIRELEDLLEDSQFYLSVKTLEQWAKLFGGAAMLINTESNPEKPLTPHDIIGKRVKFYAASRWELSGSKRWEDYYIFYGQRFHKSRVLTVSGKEAPFQIRWMLQDWGLSDMEKLLEPFNIFLRNQSAIYDLLREAKVDVYQFDGWLANLSSPLGTALAMQRIQMSNMAKSNNNAIIMDAKDKYEQKQLTFSGLAQMALENRISLASATRIPMNKLFGTGASGFSSGEDDIENYNAMVESDIREHMRPMIKSLLNILLMSKFGDTFDLRPEFKPLRVMSAKDEEIIKKSKHDRYFQNAMAGFLSPQEFMQLEQKEKLIPIESEVSKGAMPEPMGMNEEDGGEKPDNKE